MARSYKRGILQYAPDSKGSHVRWAKSQAARTIRRIPIDEEIPDGKAYRKYYSPWYIHDCWTIIHHPSWWWEKYLGRSHRLFSQEEYDKEIEEWNHRYFQRGVRVFKRT